MAFPAGAHLGSHEVVVRNNFFDPAKLTVDPGETVTWRRLEGTHTVTADDGSFRSVGTGWETFEFVTPNADVRIAYHCEVHAGMRGVLVVGNPPPPPPGERVLEVRRVPSAEFPTIASALEDPPPALIVEVEPGVYPEALVIDPSDLEPEDEPEIVVRGVGLSPGDVVLDGERRRSAGVFAAIDGVRIENLTIRGYTAYGIWWRAVERFGAREVVAEDNGLVGLYMQNARRGAVREVSARGSAQAGIKVEGCVDCDVLVDEVLAEANLQGIVAADAGGVIVRSSTVRGNGAGIVVRSTASSSSPQRGAHLYGNTVIDNVSRELLGGLPWDLPVGAGIWLDAASMDVVEANTVLGHRYNIAVTGLALGHRIVGNTVGGERGADLIWDGMGAQVCFSGNVRADGAEPASVPRGAQTVYHCSLPATVGIPLPMVRATMLADGMGLLPEPQRADDRLAELLG